MNMKIWCCALAVWWCVAAARSCDVTVGSHVYKKETLVNGVWSAGGLTVDHKTQTVYFTFYNRTQNNAKVDLKSKNFSIIEDLIGRCRFTVNQVRGEVFAGCRAEYGDPGGLYQLNSSTGLFELAGEAGRDVEFVFNYNDKLYYSAWPELLLQTFKNGQSVRLSAPASEVMNLVVDAHGDYIFRNGTGLYRWRADNGEETRYDETNFWVAALAVNSQGVFTCDTTNPHGIWRLHDRTRTATKLMDVWCTSLAFDGNDIIYADHSRHSIVRLVQC